MSLITATQIARDLLADGKLKDAGEANVEIVKMMGARLVQSPIPVDVRRALMAAVKRGEIGRLPKKGMEPEAFYNGNDNAKWKAMELRGTAAREQLESQRKAAASVLVHYSDTPAGRELA